MRAHHGRVARRSRLRLPLPPCQASPTMLVTPRVLRQGDTAPVQLSPASARDLSDDPRPAASSRSPEVQCLAVLHPRLPPARKRTQWERQPSTRRSTPASPRRSRPLPQPRRPAAGRSHLSPPTSIQVRVMTYGRVVTEGQEPAGRQVVADRQQAPAAEQTARHRVVAGCPPVGDHPPVAQGLGPGGRRVVTDGQASGNAVAQSTVVGHVPIGGRPARRLPGTSRERWCGPTRPWSLPVAVGPARPPSTSGHRRTSWPPPREDQPQPAANPQARQPPPPASDLRAAEPR